MSQTCYDKLMQGLKLLILSSLASCGYSFRRPEVRLGDQVANRESVQRVFLPVVDNLTNRSGIEPTVTSALRETLSGVRGIQLVSNVEDADYKLLVTLTDYNTKHGPTPIRGNTETSQSGGLGDKQSVASNISVTLKINARLFEKNKMDTNLYKVVWNREFEKMATFEASNRLTDETGSSSAPFINASREMIQVKMMSYGLGQSLLDQLTLNF